MFPYDFQRSCAPYVPSSPRIVQAMLELAKVTEADIVYDLGCGDGRILTTAVTTFHAQHAYGYELDAHQYQTAMQSIQQQGLQKKVTIVHGDLFEANVACATVIILYLTILGTARLRPKLEREATWETRVMSRSFTIDGWTLALSSKI